jgi:hypothetical protein
VLGLHAGNFRQDPEFEADQLTVADVDAFPVFLLINGPLPEIGRHDVAITATGATRSPNRLSGPMGSG